MELGTGIFLSSIFLGTVALYIATRDRWNWKKVFLWPLAVLFALSIVIGGGAYLYHLYDNKPRKINSYWDIPLGATTDDVLFAKGQPTNREADPNREADRWTYRLGSETHPDGWINVQFRDGKVWLVNYTAGPMYSAPKIKGIPHYAELDEIEKSLGKPSSISKAPDGTTRLYSFAQFNVFVEIEKNKIVSMGMFDGTQNAPRYREQKKSEKD